MTKTIARVRSAWTLAAPLILVASAHTQMNSTSVPFSTVQHLTAADTPSEVVAKAAHLLPRPNQTDWMRLERTFFIHFGPNTFRGAEWGTGRENPAVFNPSQLDADQWIRSVKEGGGRMVILVCKHHDGFALWPTRYSAHSVAASPWRSGHGDVVREVAAAARKYNIKLGVYLSPADLYQLHTNPTNPAGYYGDGSAKQLSTIPTDPNSFIKDPARGRTPAPGFGNRAFKVDDYNRYFLNQLYELLTEYGPIEEVWFDGANPDPSVQEAYDYGAWYDLIRQLQPHAIIFGKGPDGRWVGNESGIGRTTEWDPIPLPTPPEESRWPDMTDDDLASRAKLVPNSWLWWYPAETNVPILHGWFWAAGKATRTASELIDIYYQSVGRNSNWLLNISPDDRGLIPDLQRANLRTMNGIITETFAHDLAKGGTITADSSAPRHAPAFSLDNDLDTWWEPRAGRSSAALTLSLRRPSTFDVISLQEAVDHRGQRIESFAVDAWKDAAWQQIAVGTTVGHKRLLRLSAPVTTSRVRFRITGSRMEPTLAQLGLFKQADSISAPAISARGSEGTVTLTAPGAARIVYTLDGSVPTPHSIPYTGPVAMAGGGTLEAAILTPDGKLGMIAARSFPGQTPLGWKVVDSDSQESDGPASAAIDGNSATVWTSAESSGPHHITVDTGSVREINGFTYLPRQDGMAYGLVRQYKLETSVDGRTWDTVIADGQFANLRNNPEAVSVSFAPVKGRYFRFTSLETYDGSGAASAAELTVSTSK